jgi:hypothetical protein
MQFHGFSSVGGFASACMAIGSETLFLSFRRSTSPVPVPATLNYSTARREQLPDVPPDELTVLQIQTTGPSRLVCWHLFDAALDHYYADGVHQDYKKLLKAWGYTPETESEAQAHEERKDVLQRPIQTDDPGGRSLRVLEPDGQWCLYGVAGG